MRACVHNYIYEYSYIEYYLYYTFGDTVSCMNMWIYKYSFSQTYKQINIKEIEILNASNSATNNGSILSKEIFDRRCKNYNIAKIKLITFSSYRSWRILCIRTYEVSRPAFSPKIGFFLSLYKIIVIKYLCKHYTKITMILQILLI